MSDDPKNSELRLPLKVGVIYSDAKREYYETEALYTTEKEALSDAKIIASYLEKLGITPLLYPGNSDLPKNLISDKPDMIINLVDTVRGIDYLTSTIPGVLELLEIPYTGAGILGLSIVYNKFLVKKLLQQSGIPVPHYQLFSTANDPIDTSLRFPVISKLNGIHAAVEITEEAVSENEKHLRDRLKFLIQTYKQPVLVEEFIVGKEIAAFLLEGLNKKVYLAEKVFKKPGKKFIFATFADQWESDEYDTYHYERYDDPILREYVKKAFDVVQMDDYGKFDIRIDHAGRYYFIDSNANPAFGPKDRLCAISVVLDLYGVTFEEILKRLILNTIRGSQGKERLPFA